MSADTENDSASGRRVELPALERYINILGPLVMIVGVCVVMAFAEPRFFELPNLSIIAQDAAIYMVLGMAMTLVITSGGIDLSIGAVAALSGVVMAMLIKDAGWAVYPAMLAALAVGLLCGLANGLVITRLNVPDLLATLAMDQIYRGIALVLAAGAVLARFPEPIPYLGRGRIDEGLPEFAVNALAAIGLKNAIPTATVVGLLALAIGFVLYHRTWLGRYAIAIGGNREAALLTGISIARYKVYTYLAMGGCAAIAGVLLTGRLNAIQATTAQGFALHTIAAVVVGGTALFGGRGTMFGTLVGVVLLAMVTNSLVMLRLQFFWQLVASGVIIIASIGFYSYLQRRSGSSDY